MIKDTRIRKVTLAITWTLFSMAAAGALAFDCLRTNQHGVPEAALRELEHAAQPVWEQMYGAFTHAHPRPNMEVPPTGDPTWMRNRFFQYPHVKSVFHVSPARQLTWVKREAVEKLDLDQPLYTEHIPTTRWRLLSKEIRARRSFASSVKEATRNYNATIPEMKDRGMIFIRGSREQGYIGYVYDTSAFLAKQGQQVLVANNFADKAMWEDWSYRNALRPKIELRSDMNSLYLTPDDMALVEGAIELNKRLFIGLSLLSFALVGGIGESVRQIKALLDEREVALAQSNFVSAVSHEMRTPLTTIKMYAEMMEHGIVGDPDKQLAYLQTIGHESDRLARLVENVLGYAKVNRGNLVLAPVRLPVAEVVEEAIVAAKGALEQAGVHVQTDVTPGMTVIADRDALVQMLVNLLTNAAKYAPEGKLVFVRAIEEGGKARITVKDFGPGIPAVEHKKVFQPFYRIGSEMTRTTQGTGLGLALVDEYMKAQGGAVELESRPGDGAAFHLVFAKEEVAA